MTILCNMRVLNAPVTGVQRYAQEIFSRLPAGRVKQVAPPRWAKRPLNLLWEQAWLPLQMHAGDILWNPANSGLLGVERQIVTVHDLATVEFPEDYAPSYRMFFDFLFPRLLPGIAGVITVSEYSRQRLLATYKLDPARVRAIPLGVDHSRFKPQPLEAVERVRLKLQLPDRYVLYLGSITSRKNVQLLVQAWAKMQDSVPPAVHLVISGGDGAKHVFSASGISDLPSRCILTGRIEEEDLAPLLAGASVFVFPSLYEEFGLPPLKPWLVELPASPAMPPACLKLSATPRSLSAHATWMAWPNRWRRC